MATELDPNTFGSSQACFGCGPNNPLGLRLRFVRDDDEVSTRFVPGEGYEGPPGIFHGGLQATLLDEIALWTLVGLHERMGFTFSLQVRLLRPVRIGVEVVARGRIETINERSATVRATLEQGDKRCASAQVTVSLPDVEAAEKVLGQALPEQWHRFCRAASDRQ